jgi:hypothetical protein
MQREKNTTSSMNSGTAAGPLGQDPAPELNRALSAERIEVLAPVSAEMAEILTPEALRFVAKLARRFSATREALLQARVQRQAEIDAGKMPDFRPIPRRSARRIGPSIRCPRTYRTAASKSLAR